MKVKATDEFKKRGKHPKELNFIPEAGYEFEVSEERFEVLHGKNKDKVVYVQAIEIETAKKETKTEKAVKKTIKKKK